MKWSGYRQERDERMRPTLGRLVSVRVLGLFMLVTLGLLLVEIY